MEIVCAGFGGDGDAKTGGVAKGAVKRVVNDFDFGDGGHRREEGGVAAVAVGDGAVDGPGVAAYTGSVVVIGAALGGVGSQDLGRTESGVHARGELDHAGDHVGHYRQIAH